MGAVIEEEDVPWSLKTVRGVQCRLPNASVSLEYSRYISMKS